MPVYILECVYLLMLSLSPPHSQGHRKVWLLCVCPVAFSIAGQIPGEILSTSGSSTWDNFSFSSASVSLVFSLSVLTPFYSFWDQSRRATFLPGHPLFQDLCL